MSPSTTKRTNPLTARQSPPDSDLSDMTAAPIPGTGLDDAGRDQRFADGLRRLRIGGGTLKLNERILMVLGGILAPVGILVVLLGWWGAAHTPYVFEQLPYLVSGGLLGLGLVFLGAFFYFTHWLTQLVKEHRAQSVAVIEALGRLQEQVARLQDGAPSVVSMNGTVADPAAPEDEILVATTSGTMAHRPECAVVAGKQGLRRVRPGDGLDRCKLCRS